MSLVRMKWKLVGGASVLGVIVVGFLFYQAVHESDPHRSIRQAYVRQQSKLTPTPQVSGELTQKSKDEEIRRIEVLPVKVERDDVSKVEAPVEVSTVLKERKIENLPLEVPVFEEPPIPQALLDQTPPSRPKTGQGRASITPDRYRFNNLSPDVLGSNVVVSQDSNAKDFNLDSFAPEMEDIDVALLDNINSSALELDVAAGVWTPFYFQGHRLLEVGDKLRGQATPGRQRNRLVIRFTKVIKKDGRTLPIQGISLAEDGTLGVPGEKVGNIFQAAAGPLMAELVRGVSETFQDREKAVVGESQVLSSVPSQNMKNAGLRGSQRVLEKMEELMSEEIEENKPYLFVRAGTRLRCRLQVAVDVSQADYGK